MDFLDMLNESFNAATPQSVEQSSVVHGNYLDVGEYDATIEAVDTTKLKEKFEFNVVWADASRRTHKDRVRMFITDKESGKPRLNPDLAKLLVGLFGTPDRVLAVMGVLQSSEFAAILAVTGMKARITVRHGNGWLPATRDGKHYAKDSKTGAEVAGPCDTLDALKLVCDTAKPRKWRSFREVGSYQATGADANQAAWELAVDELNKRVVAAQAGPAKFKAPSSDPADIPF